MKFKKVEKKNPNSYKYNNPNKQLGLL